MFAFILTLIIISAVLLILVVLAQNSKGGGLSSQFGGSTSQVMGVKRTGDFLERLTWGLAIAIMALSITASAFLKSNQNSGAPTNSVIERAQKSATTPSMENQLDLGEGEGEETPQYDEGALPEDTL